MFCFSYSTLNDGSSSVGHIPTDIRNQEFDFVTFILLMLYKRKRWKSKGKLIKHLQIHLKKKAIFFDTYYPSVNLSIFSSFLSCQIKLHLTKVNLQSQMLIYSTIFSGTYTSFGYLTTILFSFEWDFWHVPASHPSWWLLILMQQNSNKYDVKYKKRDAQAVWVYLWSW